jgi:xylulose-5-phosphate/fructose-6-phosphate phosphoketolase
VIDPPAHLPSAASGPHSRARLQGEGNINTPLELAIQNQADRFSVAIDAVDRMPRFRVSGSSAHAAQLNQQIACKNHAYEFGMDSPEIANWQWPF